MERRKKTYTAAILNIVAFSIYIVASLYLVIAMIALIGGVSGADAETEALVSVAGLLVVSYLINLALDIVCLVLSCKCIKISKMSVQDYASKKGIVTSCYVINIIIVVLGVLSLISSGISAVAILDIVLWAMLIIAAVFFAIDLKKNQEQVAQEQAKVFAETASSTQTAEEKEVGSIDKLDELNKMKADGLISDEEFEKMKQDLLK